MPSIEDLIWTSSRQYRVEPTGTYTTNRNGKRVPVTKGVEYVKTTGAGEMPIDKWYKLMAAAIKEEGKQELFEKVREHVKTHCAWLHKDQDVTEYALECMSGEVYETWWRKE